MHFVWCTKPHMLKQGKLNRVRGGGFGVVGKGVWSRWASLRRESNSEDGRGELWDGDGTPGRSNSCEFEHAQGVRGPGWCCCGWSKLGSSRRWDQSGTSHFSGCGKTLSFTLRSELWKVVHRRAYLTCALTGSSGCYAERDWRGLLQVSRWEICWLVEAEVVGWMLGIFWGKANATDERMWAVKQEWRAISRCLVWDSGSMEPSSTEKERRPCRLRPPWACKRGADRL